MIIDFDTNEWLFDLHRIFEAHLPKDIHLKLKRAKFKFKEDALDAFEESVDIEVIIDATLDWIKSNHVRIFHGTRLTDLEVQEIISEGIKPLLVVDRVEWLRCTIPDLRDILTDDLVTDAVDKGSLIHRENQLHAAISLKELMGCYDYLFLGSEFDRRLLEFSGRSDLLPLITMRGKPRVIKIVIPGDEALDAMHPFFSIEDTRHNDRYPNFVRDILKEYAWLMSEPDYKRVGIDSCLLFRRAISAENIEEIETID